MQHHAEPVRVVCDFDGALPEAGLQRDVDVQGRMIRRIRLGHEEELLNQRVPAQSYNPSNSPGLWI